MYIHAHAGFGFMSHPNRYVEICGSRLEEVLMCEHEWYCVTIFADMSSCMNIYVYVYVYAYACKSEPISTSARVRMYADM